jgi:hypothetical protein
MVCVNVFKDSDGLNEDYYIVTTEDVSNLIEDIEDCFVYDDPDETLFNLLETNADKRIIDYIHNNSCDCSNIYELTIAVLSYYKLLLSHTSYEYTY